MKFCTLASTINNDASIFCIFNSNSTNFVSQLVINSLRNETVETINSLIKATIRFWSIGGTSKTKEIKQTYVWICGQQNTYWNNEKLSFLALIYHGCMGSKNGNCSTNMVCDISGRHLPDFCQHFDSVTKDRNSHSFWSICCFFIRTATNIPHSISILICFDSICYIKFFTIFIQMLDTHSASYSRNSKFSDFITI